MDGRIVSRGRGNVARCIADEWSCDSSESSFLLYFFLSLSPLFPFLFFLISLPPVCFARSTRVHTRMEDPFLGFRHPARKRTVTFWPNPLIFQPRAVLFYSFFRPPLNFGAQFCARRYLWVIETEITLLPPPPPPRRPSLSPQIIFHQKKNER